MSIDAGAVYIQSPEVAVEDFGEWSLAFHCADLRLMELNATARDLLTRLTGEKTVTEVAESMADIYCQPVKKMFLEVQRTLEQMADMEMIVRVNGNCR